MKNLLFLLFLFVSLVVCNQVCPTPLNDKACDKNAHPVCCISYDNDGKQIRREYINYCRACESGKCDFYVNGHCDHYPEDAIFCSPLAKVELCVMTVDPVCAYTGKRECNGKRCENTYDNGCLACKNSANIYYLMGKCQA